MSDRSFDIGPIRPPSEANSLLLQVTKGCTWNKCRFCVVYRNSRFSIIQPEDIKKNIDNMAYFRDLIYDSADANGTVDKKKLYSALETLNSRELSCFYMVYNWIASGAESVFLQDGNSIALKPEKLADVLFYLREKFPGIKRITTYGRAETLSRYSVDQIRLLRESGLNRVHTGFETGSDNVLKLINKGLTQEQQLDAGRKVKEAGMELSVYFMPGIGGKKYTIENAEQTAYVVNQIGPDFVRLRTYVLKLESEMYEMLLNGEYEECTDIEKLREIRALVDGIVHEDVVIASDHIVNLVGSLYGRIGDSKADMLRQIDQVLELPEQEQRVYQLARRYGFIENLSQMAQLSPLRLQQFRNRAASFTSEKMWESELNGILRQYV